MSDFKNIRDFKKSKTSKYPYQDPTYLSFVILFDFNDKSNSPFLSGAAEDYLINSLGANDPDATEENSGSNNSTSEYYTQKLIALRKFKRALATINNDMPWYWQSLRGLEVLQQWDPMQPYFGRDDAKITITTLESLNLPIAGLMHLYRKAVFDERKWNYVIPSNLRSFRMYTYVTEIRRIKNMSRPTLGGIGADNFPDNFKPSIDIKNSNDNISGQNARPYFMFALKNCKFSLDGGTLPFADLQKNPTEAATNEISITYEQLYSIEARALNGIVEDFDASNISPANDSESQNINNLGEFVNDRFSNKINELRDRSVDDLKRLSRQKKAELAQFALDATLNRVPTIDNIYQNAIQDIDNATNVNQQTRNISANIRENVFDNRQTSAEGTTIQDALEQAARNSLGNVYD